MKTTIFQSLFLAGTLLATGSAQCDQVTVEVPSKLVETGRMAQYLGQQAKEAFQSTFNAENGQKVVNAAISLVTDVKAAGKEILTSTFNDSMLYAQTVYNGGYNLENLQTHPEAFAAVAATAALIGTYGLYKLYKTKACRNKAHQAQVRASRTFKDQFANDPHVNTHFRWDLETESSNNSNSNNDY